MKYIKILFFDIKNGIFKNRFFLLSVIILPCFFCFDFLNIAGFTEVNERSFADFWIFIYGGMKEYIPSPENRFTIPALWIIFFSTIFFGALNYPYNDLFGYGKQILLRTKGRVLWWLSKCGWNIIYTLIFHGIVLLVICIFTALSGSNFNLDLNTDILTIQFQLQQKEMVSSEIKLPMLIFISPIIVSIAINLFQMTVSLFIKPIFGFLCTSVILVSSSFMMSNFMLGNFGMALRSNLIAVRGLDFEKGIEISLILAGLSIIVGTLKFWKYDIINTVN
jgi:hypothetical protein